MSQDNNKENLTIKVAILMLVLLGSVAIVIYALVPKMSIEGKRYAEELLNTINDYSDGYLNEYEFEGRYKRICDDIEAYLDTDSATKKDNDILYDCYLYQVSKEYNELKKRLEKELN